MEIQQIPIEKLKPYNENPRSIPLMAVEKVRESIKHHGFIQPLVVDQDFKICIGHTRYHALKELGEKEIPCVVKKMNKKQFIQLNIADNKSHEFTEWNLPVLEQNIAMLESETDGTLFSNEEVGLLGIHEQTPSEFENPETDVPDRAKSKTINCPACGEPIVI